MEATAAFLDGGADNTGADALGQDQVVAGARPGIGEHPLGIHQAGHGVTKLDFVVAERMAADDGAARFHHLGVSALKDLFQDVEHLRLIRKADNRERGDRPSTHGVDIA